MEDVFVVGAWRTPVGRHGGALSTVRPDDLLGDLMAEAVCRLGLDPAGIDEVVAGCANQAGEDNRNVARMATLLAGFPDSVPAVTVNRLCGSGLEAIVQGARAIRCGDARLVLAGGVESMSRAPWAMAKPEAGFPTGAPRVFDTSLGWRFENPRLAARFPLEAMGETAENLVERYAISREEQDAFALASHQKAVAAAEAGRFEAERVPVKVPRKKGDPVVVAADEGPRADSSLEKLATLKPAFRTGGTVTAGNSSTLNDGAAVTVLASGREVEARGLSPLARLVSVGHAGVDPRVMGIGPVPATRLALDRAGWKAADLDRIELNEAFAAQSLAVLRELPDLEPGKVNVNGGAIALGHPLGASGARIVATLLHELRRSGSRRGLATLCIGVGQGIAACFEVA